MQSWTRSRGVESQPRSAWTLSVLPSIVDHVLTLYCYAHLLRASFNCRPCASLRLLPCSSHTCCSLSLLALRNDSTAPCISSPRLVIIVSSEAACPAQYVRHRVRSRCCMVAAAVQADVSTVRPRRAAGHAAGLRAGAAERLQPLLPCLLLRRYRALLEACSTGGDCWRRARRKPRQRAERSAAAYSAWRRVQRRRQRRWQQLRHRLLAAAPAGQRRLLQSAGVGSRCVCSLDAGGRADCGGCGGQPASRSLPVFSGGASPAGPAAASLPPLPLPLHALHPHRHRRLPHRAGSRQRGVQQQQLVAGHRPAAEAAGRLSRQHRPAVPARPGSPPRRCSHSPPALLPRRQRGRAAAAGLGPSSCRYRRRRAPVLCRRHRSCFPWQPAPSPLLVLRCKRFAASAPSAEAGSDGSNSVGVASCPVDSTRGGVEAGAAAAALAVAAAGH